MRKHIIFWIALGTIFLFSSASAYAQVVKFDVLAPVTSIEKMMGNMNKKANDILDRITREKEKLTFLDTTKKWYEVQKARVENIQSTIEAGKQFYNDTTEMANSTVDLYESEKSKIEEEMNKAFSESGGDAIKTAQNIEGLKKQMEERKKVLLKENTAKAQDAEKNYNTLKALLESATDDQTRADIEAQMNAAAQSQAEYEENRKQIEQEKDYLLNDSEYKSLQEQKASLEKQLKEQGEQSLKSLANQVVKKLFEKTEQQVQQDYEEEIEGNFLKEDEPINAETTAPIMKYRRKVLLQDINHALSIASQKTISLHEKMETADRLSGNILRVDLSSSAISLLMEMKIEELKTLFDYVEIMLADMRLKTARNMLNQDYKLKDYSKNPAVMNLDNYLLTEEDIKSDEGKKSFLDGVKPK